MTPRMNAVHKDFNKCWNYFKVNCDNKGSKRTASTVLQEYSKRLKPNKIGMHDGALHCNKVLTCVMLYYVQSLQSNPAC